MLQELNGWRVGASRLHGLMKVYPLYRQGGRVVPYVWAGDAMRSKVVEVTDGNGEQTLRLRNAGTERVLFIEGLVLDRGHQNRGVNATMMVGGNTEVLLPVSCVEHGRSTGKSAAFDCSGSFVPTTVRATLKTEVTQSLSGGRGHHTVNRHVWRTIRQTLDSSRTVSDTESIIAVHQQHGDDLGEFADALPYVNGASGIAFALGTQIMAIELFDTEVICRQLWRALVESFAISAIGAPRSGSFTNRHAVAALLKSFEETEWSAHPATPGEGTDYRTAQALHLGSALVVDGGLIHASIVMAA